MKTIPSSSTGAYRQDEANDCVVRAITNVSGKPYNEVHALLKKHGRKDKKGTYWPTSAAAMKELGYSCVTLGKSRAAKFFEYKMNNSLINTEPRKTLGKVVSELPKGKYVVYYRGHATALVDGGIVDTFDNKKNREVVALFYDPKQFE